MLSILGETRVLVRGGPFQRWELQYPRPMCKFGDYIVDATYVTCTEHKTRFDQKEAKHKGRVSEIIDLFNQRRN